MFRRRTPPNRTGEQENPFLLSFSDLMASLLAVFILTLIVTLIQLEHRKDELDKEREKIKLSLAELLGSLEEIQKVQDSIARSLEGVSRQERSLTAMLEGIQSDLKDRGVTVLIAENGTVLRIPEQQLQFALGKYEVPEIYKDATLAIGKALLNALARDENRALLDTVFLEGHTDSVANSREMGNWGLSTYRAISLWDYWTGAKGVVPELKELKTLPLKPGESNKLLISVSGYSDTRSTHGLLLRDGLKPDRPEDRRIDIRFTLTSSEKENIEKLQDNVQHLMQSTAGLINKLKGDNDGD